MKKNYDLFLFSRVIGTLLGSIDGGVVTVTNCYKVPHKEQEEEVAINMEFNENLFRLHKKVAPQEIIVGWFTTSKRKYEKLVKHFHLNTTQGVHYNLYFISKEISCDKRIKPKLELL